MRPRSTSARASRASAVTRASSPAALEVLEQRRLLAAANVFAAAVPASSAGGIGSFATPLQAGAQAATSSPLTLPVDSTGRTVYDASRNRVYLAEGSKIQQFDVATRTLLDPIVLPQDTRPFSMDITPDDQSLYFVTLNDPTGMVHKLRLSDGTLTNLTDTAGKPVLGSGESIAIGPNGKALVTPMFAGSGWVSLLQLDLATDRLSVRTDPLFPNGTIRGGMGMWRSADRSVIVLSDNGTERSYRYDAVNDTFSEPGVITNYWTRPQPAINGDGSLIAEGYWTGTKNALKVVDGQFRTVKTLDVDAGALAFSPVANLLYVENQGTGAIEAYDTTSWAKVWSNPVGGPSFDDTFGVSYWSMALTDDGRSLFFATMYDVRVYDVSSSLVPSAPPTANPGGPYIVNEGMALTLTAQPSPTGQGPFTYEWDFAYDGQTFRPTNTGASVVFPSDIVNGPTVRTIALRVRDANGTSSDVATTTVTVNNVAPTATFAATPSSVQAGQPSKLVFTNPKDPDPSDTAAAFRYSYDLDGDHVYDIIDTPNSAVTVPGANLTATGPKLLFGRITDKDGGYTEYVTTIQVTPVVDDTQSPFSGDALPLAVDGTTTVQIENYDNGREGIAYHDTDAANLGGSTYRGTTGVDLESITDGGPGVGLGYAKAGEWLEYALVVMSRGAYDVGFRVASLKAGGSFHLEVDGVKVGNSINVPDTGAWTTWRTVTLKDVQLPEGTHTFRLAFDSNGAIGYVGNFNYMTFAKSTVTPPPPPPPDGYNGTPFSGSPIAIPATGTTTLQVEDFDNGGEGVAYHDLDAANVGGNTAYRPGGVDLATTTDGTTATILSFAKAGEWLKYSVDVAEAGAYNVGFRVSSLKTGGAFHLEVDGVKIGSSITVPDTGAWTTWRTITLNNVQLPAGRHVLTLKFDTQSSIGYVGNFNYMTLTKATVTPPPPPPTGYTGTPFNGAAAKVNASGASTIELENFDDGGEGVAYHDTDAANLGQTTYRTGGVDVEAINDGGAAGYGVGFAKAGEWLKYTVDVAADGTYDLDVRLASLSGGGAFHLEVDGVRLTPNLTVPKTGAWTTYASVGQSGVALKAGRHVVRLVMDANGSTGYVANFNWMRFTRR